MLGSYGRHRVTMTFGAICSDTVCRVSWMAFVASLVRSLAWPVGIAVGIFIVRRPLGLALSRGIRRVRAGPVEVEFDNELDEVRQELRRSPELAAADEPTLEAGVSVELARLAVASPRAAVLEAFATIERRLSELLLEAGIAVGRPTGRSMARLAHENRLISDETLSAIDGLSVLRNLAAHSPTDDIGGDRARDYLALADAVLYALRPKPNATPGP
jgi:hypothetical protein